jgi:integrase
MMEEKRSLSMPRGPKPYRATIVRYLDAEGRRCRSTDPGARKVVTRSNSYYADIWLNNKRERINLETTNLTVAWRNLRAELKRRADEELGIRDRYTDAAQKALAEHLDDWLRAVEAGGATSKHVAGLRQKVELLAAEAGWVRATDIDRQGATLALARLCAPGEGERRKAKGRSAQTRNHLTSAARQFAAWLHQEGRLREDPLRGLARVDVGADRRHDRRTPTGEEVAKLFEALAREDAPARAGMTAAQRGLGYRVAMATGLRANELRSLTRDSFDLDGCRIVLAARSSKRRTEDSLPLPPWLVALLRAWLEAGGGLWEAFPEWHPGSILKLDLAAAGVAYALPGPGGRELFFDFHSLRHWYCTWAAHVPGISPRTLLALTRHSTVELAMGTYGMTRAGDVRAAVDGMPEPGR